LKKNNNESQISGFWFGYIDVMAMLASIILICMINLLAKHFPNIH